MNLNTQNRLISIKKKIKATQSNFLENECSNLASLEMFSDDFLEDSRQQLKIQDWENF